MSEKVIVSYGGGTNSAGMLVGLWERGERPDAITFADTGNEKPYTYEHIRLTSAWAISVGFPEIETVKGSQPQQIKDGSLYNECIRLGKLPAKAYGFSSCSQKWKIDPQEKFNRTFAAQHGIAVGEITRLIGFDAGEPGRVMRAQEKAGNKIYKERYPLYEWGWAREECMAAIERAGLPQPGKSACFFCPSAKLHEIRSLQQNYPDLLQMALEMERRALAGEGQAPRTTGKGLGRAFSWADATAQTCLVFSDAGTPEEDCGCYDGE